MTPAHCILHMSAWDANEAYDIGFEAGCRAMRKRLILPGEELPFEPEPLCDPKDVVPIDPTDWDH